MAMGFVAAGGVAVAISAIRGLLHPAALDGAPSRRAGLRAMDLPLGLACMFMGGAAVGFLLQRLGFLGADMRPKVSGPAEYALGIAIQCGTKGAAAGYFLFRAASFPGGLSQVGARPGWRDLYTAAVAIAVALPVVFAVSAIGSVITGLLGHPTPKVGHETLKALIETDSHASIALMVLSAAVVAPVLEELVFRGLVQTTLLAAWGELQPLGRARAVVVFFASLMFAAVHVGVAAPHALPALFTLSLILGWVYERTGRLWPCVLIHAGFNLVNLTWALAMRNAGA